MKHKSNGYHDSKKLKGINEETLIFPVTYELKAVMSSVSGDDTNIEKLSIELTKHKVEFKLQAKKDSSKGNYTSYTFKVTLLNKEQMDNLYEDLKKVEGLKFAV